MRKLTLNDKEAVLNPDVQVRMVKESILFGGRGIYTFPIELPLQMDINKLAIDHMDNLFVSGNRSKPFEARYYQDGITLLAGLAELQEINYQQAELLLKGNSLDFWTRAADIALKDLAWPEIAQFGPAAPVFREAAIRVELMDCMNTHKAYTVFPLVNMFADEDDNRLLLNDWDFQLQEFIIPGDTETITSIEGEDYVQGNSVFMRAYAVFDKLFELMGYAVKENYFASTDELKEVVMLNSTHIVGIDEDVHWHHFLPDISVKEFVEIWESSGVKFDIDSTRREVYITRSKDIMARPAKPIQELVSRSVKITPETNDGFVLSINQADSYPNAAFKMEELFDDIELVDRINANVATENDMPEFIIWPLLVKSTGVLWGSEANAFNTYEAKLRTLPKFSGAKELEVNVQVCPVANKMMLKQMTHPEDGSPQSGEVVMVELSAVCINHAGIDGEKYSTKSVMLSVSRGLQEYYLGFGTDLPEGQRTYPHAHYLPYDASGNDILGIALDTHFFYDLYADYIALMEGSYRVELKYLEWIREFLEFPQSPLLFNGQKIHPESLAISLREHVDLLEYTLTGRIKTIASVENNAES